MARPRKIESDRSFSARMLHEAVSRYDQSDDTTDGLDIMIYWSRKLLETLLLQQSTLKESQNAPLDSQTSQQEPLGSQVPPTKPANRSR